MKIRIAITGGIACGKSLVGTVLSSEGFAVREADEVARELMRPGSGVYRQVVAAFGTRILDSNGRIDRVRLGEIAFSCAQSRHRLNSIVHPAVASEFGRWLRSFESECSSHGGDVKAAAIVPLLYEAGMAKGWDAVVCVRCNRKVQVQRMLERGHSEDEAARRIDAQIKIEEKMSRSDYVISNDGSRRVLREQIEKVLNSIQEA